MRDIAIVGGGPAGALCGERLATAGFHVTLFDEHLAWEKPCGGGLTQKAVQKYPFLLDGPQPKRAVHRAELISGRGQRVRFDLGRPIIIYSRKVLNGLLLDRAAAAGCRTIQSRVTHLAVDRAGVNLTAGGRSHDAEFVVLAAGARNQLLPGTTPLKSSDLEMTVGYFVPVVQDIIKVKFLPGFEGYLWSFPRADHLSVGICGRMSQSSSHTLRRHLDDFMREEKLPTQGARFFGHVLPSPEARTLRERRIVGERWALAGDAAACVDPITGEGLFYALRSGDLLAQALAEGAPESYPRRLQAEFSADLEFAARIARKIFRGNFLGAAVTTRMVQFLRRSATFRDLMRDVFSGAQDYRTLKRRLWKQVAATLIEIAQSLVESQEPLPAAERESTV
jgi:geranylgeranyl diphosphate/geranylgeranyl-bacteriochlorophyllide a reductase